MSAWRKLITEIHRRSLWQVLSVYLMGSWVAFQVILDLVEGIGLPSWLPGLAAALFVIGLPIVLATAFVQKGLPGSTEAKSATLDPTLFPGAESAAPVEARVSRGFAGVLTWQRAILAGLAAFALLGLVTAGWLALRALGVGPMASLLAAEELERNDRVLIAEFEPRGADSTLTAVVTDAFRIDFARSTLLRAVTTEEVQDALQRMGLTSTPRLDAELARQIAIRDGISTYITGELAATGSSYIVTARLIATATGEVLVALRERAREEEDLIDAVDRLSTELRERTGESLRTIRRAEPLAKVTTSSLEALKSFTQGNRASSWEGDPDRALELHQRAVELDTAFAAAYRALAVHWYNRGETERSMAAAERALHFSDRLTDVERAATQSMLHVARGELAEAAGALERVLHLDSTNFAATNNLGLVYAALDDKVRAEEYYRRAVLLDTTRFFGYVNLGEQLVVNGKFDEAERAFEAAVERAPQSAWAVGNLALAPYTRRDYDEAERRLRAVIADPASARPVQERATQFLYNLLRIRGRLAESERVAQQLRTGTGVGAETEAFRAVDRALSEAFIARRSDLISRRLAEMRAAVKQSGAERALTEGAATCGWSGDAECARELLAAAGANAELTRWSSLSVRFAHAGLAYAEDRPTRALEILREAPVTECEACELALIGQTFDAMNRPDSAAAAYEAYASTSSIDHIWSDFELGSIHEWLARYHAERGNRAAAAQHYARLVDLWEDADAVLQPRVAAARARLEQLQPDRGT